MIILLLCVFINGTYNGFYWPDVQKNKHPTKPWSLNKHYRLLENAGQMCTVFLRACKGSGCTCGEGAVVVFCKQKDILPYSA